MQLHQEWPGIILFSFVFAEGQTDFEWIEIKYSKQWKMTVKDDGEEHKIQLTILSINLKNQEIDQNKKTTNF